MSAEKLIEQIDRLIETGIALSSQGDKEILLEKILLSAKSITHADGGTLYQTDGKGMRIQIIYSDSLQIHLGGSSGNVVDMSPVPLYLADGSVNLSHVVCYSYHNKVAVHVADVYADDNGFDFSGPIKFDRNYHYKTKSLLTIPLKNHKGEVIGVLQLVNAKDPSSGEVIEFDHVSQKITAAMASQAAIVLTQQQLIADLEKLFQSLVKLVATAIDKKSPYTGAHSRRVPILTMMLAEAVHEADFGPYKDFKLSEADRYELEIAAWLHDCGKITTPEYVMDKATKLQTIFDRVNLIETRFEVLKRDHEIEWLKHKIAALENGEPYDPQREQAYRQSVAKIDDDMAFIKHLNFGSESTSPKDLARVEAIREQTWQRAGEILPCLTDDEVYNLRIPYGTLTPEERQIINHHITATIAMLESIEFPTHLSNVPEFAGGHHERMDGKGYPRGLRRDQLSLQARIMGIADIFEALVDAGRPYKVGKKLSEALHILEKMKNTGHIDPDLYDVFMEQKVYQRYAEQYVAPEQIDVF